MTGQPGVEDQWAPVKEHTHPELRRGGGGQVQNSHYLGLSGVARQPSSAWTTPSYPIKHAQSGKRHFPEFCFSIKASGRGRARRLSVPADPGGRGSSKAAPVSARGPRAGRASGRHRKFGALGRDRGVTFGLPAARKGDDPTFPSLGAEVQEGVEFRSATQGGLFPAAPRGPPPPPGPPRPPSATSAASARPAALTPPNPEPQAQLPAPSRGARAPHLPAGAPSPQGPRAPSAHVPQP